MASKEPPTHLEHLIRVQGVHYKPRILSGFSLAINEAVSVAKQCEREIQVEYGGIIVRVAPMSQPLELLDAYASMARQLSLFPLARRVIGP